MKFYKCTSCDQVYMKLFDNDSIPTCCEIETGLIIENELEEEAVNHMVNVRKIGNFLTISITDHPMIDIHHIKYVCMETNQGFQYKKLSIETEPKVTFILENNETINNVYVYCSLHGLFTLPHEKK